jgi:hypothetical protein
MQNVRLCSSAFIVVQHLFSYDEDAAGGRWNTMYLSEGKCQVQRDFQLIQDSARTWLMR